jgi:hypothetical protein
VGVLEKVRDILRPLIGAGVLNARELEKAGAAADKSKHEGPFRNMFGILSVYEPSEAFRDAPDAIDPTPPDHVPMAAGVKYGMEPDNSLEEVFFALTTLFNDYERLREEIKSLWAEYKAGQLDLAAVSVATNTAFELARSMEDDIKPMLDSNGGGISVM